MKQKFKLQYFLQFTNSLSPIVADEAYREQINELPILCNAEGEYLGHIIKTPAKNFYILIQDDGELYMVVMSYKPIKENIKVKTRILYKISKFMSEHLFFTLLENVPFAEFSSNKNLS